MKKMFATFSLLLVMSLMVQVAPAIAAPNGVTGGDFSLPSIALNMAEGGTKPTELVNVLKIVLLLTVLTLAPAILVMMTSFTFAASSLISFGSAGGAADSSSR